MLEEKTRIRIISLPKVLPWNLHGDLQCRGKQIETEQVERWPFLIVHCFSIFKGYRGDSTYQQKISKKAKNRERRKQEKKACVSKEKPSNGKTGNKND